MDTVVKRVLTALLAVCLTIAGIFCCARLTERKNSMEKYDGFFSEKGSFDVLFFGTSHVIDGIYPMELWADYGIVSYNMAGHNCPLATSYWTMMNALDYSSPKLIVIDAYNLDEDSKAAPKNFEYLHLSLDAFPLSMNKIRAAFDLCDDVSGKEGREFYGSERENSPIELLWEYSVYHSRWNELEPGDFSLEPELDKGAEMRVAVTAPNEYEKISRDVKYTGDSVSVEYLRKMIEECRSRGIEVLLTCLPFPADRTAQKNANRLYDIADEYGVDYINFLDMDIVDYGIDCFDTNSHLNPSGARKVTEYLGCYMQEHYDIPDHRGEELYASWNDDYEAYCAEKEENILKADAFTKYMMLMNDGAYDCLVELDTVYAYGTEKLTRILRNIGIDAAMIDESGAALSVKGGRSVTYISPGEKAETPAGEIRLVRDEKTRAALLDGKLLYERDAAKTDDGYIHVTLFRHDTGKVADCIEFPAFIKIKEDGPNLFITGWER